MGIHVFYKHNVYKHTQVQISKKLSISEAYFWASLLYEFDALTAPEIDIRESTLRAGHLQFVLVFCI